MANSGTHGAPRTLPLCPRKQTFEVEGPRPHRVIDLEEIIQGEYAENSDRKDFGPTEYVAILRALRPVLATPKGKRAKADNGETFPIKRAPQTRDKVAAFAGVSGWEGCESFATFTNS
jgi:hypothetical protein